MVLALAIPAAASAQAIERNLPQTPARPRTDLDAPAIPGTLSDDRPLGTPLRALILLGQSDAPQQNTDAEGVNSAVIARLNTPHERAWMERFLGQPISRKLISQIEAGIVQRYRALGYPFVQVSTPEQEITHGVLQLRVAEFRLGTARATGGRAAEQKRVSAAIRTYSGDSINADKLSEDLDWLNRDPRRAVTTTFSPGAKAAETDLTLAISTARPWGLNAGYANSGSPMTGQGRFSIGGYVYGHILADEALSVQVTGSPDFWISGGKPFHNGAPRYESAAGRLQIFTAPRQLLELTLNAVETNEPVQDFIIRQRTTEATVAYHSALSNLLPIRGDIAGGIEISHQARDTSFGGVTVVQTSQNVYQLFGSWSDHWTDRLGSSGLDVSLHYSPGGIDSLNTDQAFADFTNGRVLRASYFYAQASFMHQASLPWALSLITQIHGQYAGRSIPDSQQIALGGQSAVRGYSFDDGAWDDGIVMHNDLRAREWGLGATGGVTPRAFLDFGWGKSDAAHINVQQVSGGVGGDIRMGSRAIASLGVAIPMTSGRETRAGVVRFDVRVSLAY